MNARERKFWTRLRPKFLEAGVQSERIENAVGKGRPDVETLYAGSVLPIELKAIAAFPKMARTAVLGKKKGLRQSQMNWFLNRRRHGGDGLIVVSVGQEVFAFGIADHDNVNLFNTGQFRAAALAHGIPELIELIKGKV